MIYYRLGSKVSIKDLIVRELDEVAETALPEVLDFVRLLKARNAAEGLGNAVASESALRKDWLRPEEDRAWANL